MVQQGRTGMTSTDSLTQSLPLVIAAARIVREYSGIMPSLTRTVTLEPGTGLTWYEVQAEQLQAQTLTETQAQDNPQMIEDYRIGHTPIVSGIQTLITDRLMTRISPNVAMRIGSLAQNAIQRKKDQDGLLVFNAGVPLGSDSVSAITNYLSAAAARIMGNDREPAMSPMYAVLHPFVIKFIQDSLTASIEGAVGGASGVDRRPVQMGLTQQSFIQGFMMGEIYGVMVYRDGNIQRQVKTGGHFAVGGIFPREGIILVQGRMPKVEAQRRPEIEMGATALYHRDEYVYGTAQAVEETWVYKMTSDATAPTS